MVGRLAGVERERRLKMSTILEKRNKLLIGLVVSMSLLLYLIMQIKRIFLPWIIYSQQFKHSNSVIKGEELGIISTELLEHGIASKGSSWRPLDLNRGKVLKYSKQI